MKIKFKGEYKSLSSFESDDISEFCVITGKNGSGKSQLLELISQKARNGLSSLMKFEFSEVIDKIQVEGIENNNLLTHGNESWISRIKPFANEFLSLGTNSRKLLPLLYESNLNSEMLNYEGVFEKITSISKEELSTLFIESLKEFDRAFFVNDNKDIKRVVNRFFRQNYLRYYKTIEISKYVAKYKNKDFNQLTHVDFYSTPLPISFFETPQLFNPELEFVFYSYAKRRDLNNRQFFDKKEYGDKNESISDKEFIVKFPPPWDNMNKILNDLKLDFQFKGIERQNFSDDIIVEVQLLKSSINKIIEFKSLSSGEKVILGLITKLFTSKFYKDNLELPDLIVLDEPDAYLHPEMSKLLIDVLEGVFVKELGVNVIFTTHSPSTIALCPEDSIYQLQNHPKTKLSKVSKNEALKILTEFIPTLSIDYNSHRQVFVESPTDRFYYQTIFDKVNLYKLYPFKLYFISNGYGKGNCNQVIDIVTRIRETNNKTCFGIIDWDSKNKPTDYTFIHGQDSRYSIENYVYDPIYLIVLFLEMDAYNIRDLFDLGLFFNEYNIGLHEDTMQKLVDWFFEKLYEKISLSETIIAEKTIVEYFNGSKVLIPKWYLIYDGHDLEDKLRKAFQPLEKFQNTGELQNKLTVISAKCYPLIHTDTVNLFNKIINTE